MADKFRSGIGMLLQSRFQRIILFSALPGLAFGAFLFGTVLSAKTHAAEISQPEAVVELFTSQGCSSCPPADKLLHTINKRKRILGLALHVDYWDHIGWKDIFAKPEYTKRQWDYARALGERQVYTPQAVVNGRRHVVGSNEDQIFSAIRAFEKGNKGLNVPVNARLGDDKLQIEIPPVKNEATLRIYYFNDARKVKITRGENAGRELIYSNVVGKIEMLGMASSKGMKVSFSLAEMRKKDYENCAFVLQQNGPDGLPGPILGATAVSGI